MTLNLFLEMINFEPQLEAHICNSRTLEVDAGESQVQSQPELHDTISKKVNSMVYFNTKSVFLFTYLFHFSFLDTGSHVARLVLLILLPSTPEN